MSNPKRWLHPPVHMKSIQECDWHDFDVETFKTQVWQQAPLVIRGMFASTDFLDPDELAGLSCEVEAEARIIRQKKQAWEVHHGPFDEETFPELGDRDWTLLVQAVDHWVPEVADILEQFDFLPRWRLDDIMVSYAPKGGTVAEHFDFFDVFLIQGSGQRRWQLGEVCGTHTTFVPDTPLRLLKEFTPIQETILEPGDVLYVPAKLSHYGVSLKHSMTYSVGFRAPSVREIVDGVATASLEQLTEDTRYQDTVETLCASRGQIPMQSIEMLQSMVLEALSDKSLLGEWFGQRVTERKYPDLEDVSSAVQNVSVDEMFWSSDKMLMKSSQSRFAYLSDSLSCAADETKVCLLFVDGLSYQASLSLARQLCDFDGVDKDVLHDSLKDYEGNAHVLEQLLLEGALLLEE